MTWPYLLQGEDAAILGTVGALTDCLQRPGGCAVVPGIPSDQYTLTLITSLVGGVVFGYSLRLEPSGILVALTALCTLCSATSSFAHTGKTVFQQASMLQVQCVGNGSGHFCLLRCGVPCSSTLGLDPLSAGRRILCQCWAMLLASWQQQLWCSSLLFFLKVLLRALCGRRKINDPI